MNVKFLVETLIEIPDGELLAELEQEVAAKQSLLLSDLNLFYKMLACLFSGTNKAIILQALLFYQKMFKLLLDIDVEQSWRQTSRSIIRLSGAEDLQLRKKATELMLEVIVVTGNINIVLQKLYYEGMEDESILVVVSSIKNCCRIIQLYPGLLQNKTSINVVKLLLEKMICLGLNGNHMELQRNAYEFLDKIFYLKVDRLDQVLMIMNPVLLERLQKIWAVNKQKMLNRQEGESDERPQFMEIGYQHLPLINGKFFGVFEIYIFKNLFNPEVKAAKRIAAKDFWQTFETHQHQLQKYLNVIYKVILKFLPDQHYELLLVLKKIVATNGIANIVNLAVLPRVLMAELDTEQVIYRRDLREVLKHVNLLLGSKCLRYYRQVFQNQVVMHWIKMFELLGLLEHLIDNNLDDCYPPALDSFLPVLCRNLSSSQMKIKDKSFWLMAHILDQYPGYRENLENILSQDQIAEIEDLMESGNNQAQASLTSQEAGHIFMQEYQQQRHRYIRFKDV